MEDQSPIFIVGMNGSGTTMLADSLGSHPEIYTFRLEAKVLPYFLLRSAEFGDLVTFQARRRLADAMGRTKEIWQVNGNRALVLKDAQLSQVGYGGVVNAIFSEFASREGKSRWGEKSPMNLGHISALAEALPDAKFVHIIRDGRECAQSFHRRYRYDPLHTIFRWKKLVAIGREQGFSIGRNRYMEVKYEALTHDPEKNMRRIAEFLRVPYSECLIQSSMRMTDEKVAGDKKQIIQNSDKWKEYFDPAVIHGMERIAGAMLCELGYETQGVGDDSPSRLRCQWSLMRGRFHSTVNNLKRWGWKSVPGLLRAARVSWMQDRVDRT